MEPLKLDPETERLLEIPAFLDRSKWTPEQFAESERAWQRVLMRASEEAAERRRVRERSVRAAQIEREAKAQAKADRRQAKQAQKARAVQRKSDRAEVVQLIRSGHLTIGQMAKASGIPKERLKPAIRWLLRKGHIDKATPRTYTANA